MRARHYKKGYPVLLPVEFINDFRFKGASKLAPCAIKAARATALLKAAQ